MFQHKTYSNYQKAVWTIYLHKAFLIYHLHFFPTKLKLLKNKII
jgi:hypothetical protein